MILIIDNYDSFTYNLYQQVETLGFKTKVFKHDKINIDEINRLKPKKIIISPGPKTPDFSGISMKVVQKFYSHIPILGVCLGHQCIGQVFGSKVVHAKNILHGKTSKVFHSENKLFSNVQNPVEAARYHSLILNEVPKDFMLTAWTDKNEIMAMQHNTLPIYSVQFHPESFLTKEGNKIMNNFLND